jgi:hypothetical protein
MIKTQPQPQPLRPQDLSWIKEREWWFTGVNRTLPAEDGPHLWAILSWASGRTQTPSACGRCWTTARQTVWSLYLKQTQSL